MKPDELVPNNIYSSKIGIPSCGIKVGDFLVFIRLSVGGWACCRQFLDKEKAEIMVRPSELEEETYVMGVDEALGIDHSVVVPITKSVLGEEIVLKPGESVLNHAGKLFGPSPLSNMSFLSLKNISNHRLDIGDGGVALSIGEEYFTTDKILIDKILKSKIVEDLSAKGSLKINYKGSVDFDVVEEDACTVCEGNEYLYSKDKRYPCPACNSSKKKLSIKPSPKLGERKVKFS